MTLLTNAKLTLNLNKCKFGLQKVDYLGYTFGRNGMSPGNKTLNAIVNFPTPKNSHEARRFNDLDSFFRRFIKNFATIMAPITGLFKDNKKFVWGNKQNSAFENIKHLMSSQLIIAYFNPKAKSTELHTEASSAGLGAMLFQEGNDGLLHLVYAVSRRTTDVEKNYHSSKLELMAIV